MFELRVAEFQMEFKSKAPFNFDEGADVYDELDVWHAKMLQVLRVFVIQAQPQLHRREIVTDAHSYGID